MAYDIVYPLKAFEPNFELIYSLRSLERFGGEIGKVWIVGYIPAYLQNVYSIPRDQTQDKYRNTRLNLIAACRKSGVSSNFILMNDDFILTKPIKDWKEVTNVHLGKLIDHGERFQEKGGCKNPYQSGFFFNHYLLKSLGVEEPLDYEVHGPLLINKKKWLEIVDHPDVARFQHVMNPRIFKRSVYCNLAGYAGGKQIEDVKVRDDLFQENMLTDHGFFSTADGLVGYRTVAPRLNAFLKEMFPEKSRYEKALPWE